MEINLDSLFLDPLRDMLDVIFQYIPQVVGALVLLLIAWILAKLLRRVVRKILKATKIDERIASGRYQIAQRTGTWVFWLVWLFFGLAVLQSLGVEGVLSSVAILFERIFEAVPNIVGAVIILLLFYLIGQLLAAWVTKILTSVRFNEVPVRLGLMQQPTTGDLTPAKIVGYVVLVFIMLFSVMMAADLLNFTVVNELLSSLTAFLALVLLAIVILAVGILTAGWAASAIIASGQPRGIATAARIVIIGIIAAMALRTLGIANDIIVLTVGLLLGSVAVAAAVAFGLGGRDVAKELLSRWTGTLTNRKDK